jgi:hypothetical protein
MCAKTNQVHSTACGRVRPQDTPQIARDDWFSLFVLHQNRVAHGSAVSGGGHKMGRSLQVLFVPKVLNMLASGITLGRRGSSCPCYVWFLGSTPEGGPGYAFSFTHDARG